MICEGRLVSVCEIGSDHPGRIAVVIDPPGLEVVDADSVADRQEGPKSSINRFVLDPKFTNVKSFISPVECKCILYTKNKKVKKRNKMNKRC